MAMIQWGLPLEISIAKEAKEPETTVVENT
jgi:hypothetical protein